MSDHKGESYPEQLMREVTPHARPTTLFSHARRDTFDWGNFYTDRGQLVGHYALDVNAWLAQHPDFAGSLFFDYGQGDDQIDVTDIFFSEPDEIAINRRGL